MRQLIIDNLALGPGQVVDDQDQLSVGGREKGHLNHGGNRPCLVVHHKEENLRVLLGEALQLNQLRAPLLHLGIVVGDAQALQLRNDHLGAPPRWVAGATEENYK